MCSKLGFFYKMTAGFDCLKCIICSRGPIVPRVFLHPQCPLGYLSQNLKILWLGQRGSPRRRLYLLKLVQCFCPSLDKVVQCIFVSLPGFAIQAQHQKVKLICSHFATSNRACSTRVTHELEWSTFDLPEIDFHPCRCLEEKRFFKLKTGCDKFVLGITFSTPKASTSCF